MPQPIDFLISIVTEAGKSYVYNNGNVSTSGTPSPLKIGPNGIDGVEIKYGRSSKYFRVFRSFTTPLQFVRDGAKILRKVFYTIGFDAIIYLVIHRLNKSFGAGWKHEFMYKGELNMVKSQDSDHEFSVEVMEGDIHKLFRANESTVYTIPVDEVKVKTDGVDLFEKMIWEILPGSVSSKHVIGMVFINNEGQSLGVQHFTTYHSANPGTGDFHFISSSMDIFNLRLQGTIVVSWGAATSTVAPVPIKLLAITPANGSTPAVIRTFALGSYTQPAPGNASNLPQSTAETFAFDVTFNAKPGEIFWLYADGVPIVSGYKYWSGRATLSYVARYPVTYTMGNRPVTLGQRLVDKIMGPGYIFQSSYLTKEWNNLVFTSGDAIRGFPDPVQKISWNDFYNSLNVPCNLSLRLKDNIVSVEKFEEAFKPNVSISLGEVKGLKKRVAENYLYNVIKIGWPDVSIEDVNGRNEFNVTHTYSTPIKKAPKEMDLVSKVVASMYDIEFTRINNDGKTTTNNQNDNKNFFLLVEKTPTDLPVVGIHYKLLRETYDSVTGLLTPSTAFNIPLSPKRCLLAHSNYLASMLYFHKSGSVKFETGDRNHELKTEKSGVIVEEKANVFVSKLGKPLFIPYVFTFESPIPKNIIHVMETNPDETIEFISEGETHYGFAEEIGIRPSTNPAMDTTLLFSSTVDMTKFE